MPIFSPVPTEGDDFLVGSNADEEIDALGGNDIVLASGGDDLVLGGSGDDVLLGEYGDDELVGNTGDDVMVGGYGDDRMVWNNGDGSDIMEGEEDYDVAEVNGSDTLGDEFEIAADGHRVDFARVNFGQFTLDIGTTEKLEVNGQGGDDIITASKGLDGLIKLKLYGDKGNDTITGGDGDDVIVGGKGYDVLTGGKGADVFVFEYGKDVITDFEKGVDVVKFDHIKGIHSYDDVEDWISQEGDDVVIDFGGKELTYEDAKAHWFDEDAFIF